MRASDDRRRVELTLTAAGRKVLGGAPEVVQDRFISALGSMPAGKRRLLAELLNEFVTGAGLADTVPSFFFEEDSGPRLKGRQPKRKA